MTSKLVQMQARFQQKQMQEKEEKLLKLYESQQQRAFERVGRGSAGSNTTISSVTSIGSGGGGKVRQMFDERRQKAGVDRSYPLEPLKSKARIPSLDRKKSTSRATVKSTVQNSFTVTKNSKPVINKREVVHSVYNNNDGDESYQEHRYENNGDDSPIYDSYNELTNMMDRHNLNDNLDYEEMPHIGFDEIDNHLHKNDQLPSANEATRENERRNDFRTNGGAVKRENKNVVLKRSTTRVSPQAKTTSPVKSQTSPKASTKSSPPMSSNKVTKPSASADRAPSNNRPSAKQTVRSAVVRDDLTECHNCGRRFAADRIQKHEEVCTKTAKKKRKAYDATKHRVTGTEMETYVIRGNKKVHSNARANRPPPKKDWRKTHEEFIATIRAAKEAQAFLAQGGKLSDLPPPPPSTNPDYVQCPHCGRKFNEAAAERHIPKCANFQFNKPKPNATKPPLRTNRR